jgi:hypothetical protein
MRKNQNFLYTFIRVCLIVVVVAGLAIAPGARADSVNSPNITLNVDTNRAVGAGNGAGNVAVVINTITIAETNVNEYSSGAGKLITIRVRPGFQFDPASNVTAQSATIGINGGGVNVIASVTPAGTADEVITFNFTSGTGGGQDIIRINGIRIKIISAAGAAGPAQTTMAITTSAAGGAFNNQGIVAANITKGAGDHLEFSTQPGSNLAGNDLLPAVKIVDFGGNIVNTGDFRTITLAIQANPGAATLLGTAQHDTFNGVATWVDADDLRITTAAANYTLRASHNGSPLLTSQTVDSAAFDITGAAPNKLVITKQPVNTAAGEDILIDVSMFDAFDNPVLASPVDVTLDSSVNPGGWPLLTASSLTKTTVNGVASWSAADDLRITAAVAGYRLVASGLNAPAQSNNFDITPGTPSALRFVQQPTNVAQNAAVNPAITVEIIDAFANRTTSNAAVQLALLTAPCGGTVSGGAVNAVNGLATFDALSFNTACTGNVLEASSGALVRASSDLFNVTALAAAAAACGACGPGAAMTLAPLMLIHIGLRRRRVLKKRSPRAPR